MLVRVGLAEGEYDGHVGEYDGLVGEYDGLVGEYDGLEGEYDAVAGAGLFLLGLGGGNVLNTSSILSLSSSNNFPP